jgi:uncharacterized protein YndB with AHSA1/START domain
MDVTWKGSVEIDAPVDRVYAHLADFPKHCEWAQTLERMELKKAGSGSGVGAVYRTYEKQAMHADRAPRGPLPAKAFKGTTECEITDLVPGKRIAWRAHPVPVGMGVHAELAFDLAPIDANRTRLTQTISSHQPWLPFQIFARFVFKTNPATMEQKAQAQWQASLDNIKAILEEPAGRDRPAAD